VRIRIADLVISAVISICAILGFFFTYTIPAHDTFLYGDAVYASPSFFPRIVLTILAVLSVILLVKSIVTTSADTIPWTGRDIRRVFIAFALFLFYPLFLRILGNLFVTPGMGFVISSGVLLICTMIGLGFRRYHWILLTSLLVVGFVYGFFVLFLKIMLP
jgi:hypothetical protein